MYPENIPAWVVREWEKEHHGLAIDIHSEEFKLWWTQVQETMNKLADQHESFQDHERDN